MKRWIARDKSGAIWLYENKPFCSDGRTFWASVKKEETLQLLDAHFPEVTFENSPMEVELKLVNNVQSE